MNRLSDRLQVIAERINEGETMADIGTDHGFLPIYLVEKGISPKAVMSDVSEKSLEKGRKNAYMMLSDITMVESLDFRCGDGLKVLKSGEVDTVVIAGMGGKLMVEMLDNDIEHTCSFKKFILQPRIGQGHLRKWLTDSGFKIINEAVVIEGGHIPEIITALSPHCSGEAMNLRYADELDEYRGDNVMWKIPPWMASAEGPVEKFLTENITMSELKLENVKKARSRDIALEEKIADEIRYLRGLLKEIENVKGKRNC